MSYRVRTQAFTGPFDLLLSLVSRQRVAIGSISIAEVADQYLDEVRRMGEMDLDVASDFVLVASTLLDIKAASLVPAEPVERVVDPEEDELANLTPEMAREMLIERLIAYKQFRNAGMALASRMEVESLMLPRTAGPDPEFLGLMPNFLEGVSLRSLAVICADLTSRRESFLLDAEHVAARRAPVALTVAAVDRITRTRGHVTFSELLDGDMSPQTVVVTFLAMLELFKRGSITVRQAQTFGEIDIVRVEGAPAFELDEAPFTSVGEEDF
ncbi:MAG: segregation/condensation protein A [Atopobiaceae bacterium]|nr:segregation/condensation protein A [Atopobiaceae bacterium]MBR3313599.1 segregation/condensation protein A [Atopobiaceae bacterium]